MMGIPSREFKNNIVSNFMDFWANREKSSCDYNVGIPPISRRAQSSEKRKAIHDSMYMIFDYNMRIMCLHSRYPI